jgi:hypothetical protein
MSSTGRGTIRNKDDFYETPIYTIRSLLDNHDIKYPALECAAGRGAIVEQMDGAVFTLDINPEFHPLECGDYLDTDIIYPFNTIITNPPYSLAQEFIEKALNDVEDDGEVIMLLRINFMESLKRAEFWKTNPPSHMYVLSRRPSFTGKGTDSTGYAWFVWTKGKTDNNVQIKWV